MKNIISIFAICFWLAALMDVAHAKKFKQASMPNNLTYADGEHCGTNTNRGFDMKGCKTSIKYIKITEPKYKKDYLTSSSAYETYVSKRIVKKAHKLKNGARVEAGDEVFGLALILMGEVKDKANKKYKRRKRIASEWLIKPEWSKIVAWRSDFALVKKPGTEQWYRISLPNGKLTPWHKGDIIKARGFSLNTTKNDKLKKKPVFLLQSESDGTLTARLMVMDAEVELGPAVDRILKLSDMPEDRVPLEVFTDGTILAHRLDENGKVYDQMFVSSFDRALSPPMTPIRTVVIPNHVNARKNHRTPLVEIDPAKGLYWPVTTGVSVISKPENLIGMRPLQKGADRTLSPIDAHFISAGRDGAFKSCIAGTPECPFGSYWIGVWDDADGLTFTPTGTYNPSRFPPLDMLTQRHEGFVFTELRPVPVPETLTQLHVHHYTIRQANKFAAGRNKQGQYEAMGWYSGYTSSGIKLRPLSATPRASFALAANDVELFARSVIKQKQEREAARRAEEKAYQDMLKRREEEARQRRVAAQNQARQNMKQALAAGQYAQALDYSIYADARAVGDAAVAAIRAGYGHLVSDAELYTAVRALPTNQRGTVQREMDERRDASRAAALRASQMPSTGYSSSSTTQTKRYNNPASISRPTDYEWQSKLNYLKGNTSQYKCGSSSFCN